MTEESKERWFKAAKNGDVTYSNANEPDSIIPYEYYLEHDGGHFTLLVTYESDAGIEKAKAALRNNQDVLSIKIERLK